MNDTPKPLQDGPEPPCADSASGVLGRREFLKLAGVPSILAVLPGAVLAASGVGDDTDAAIGNTKGAVLSSPQFSLSLKAGNGLQCRLVHLPTNTLLADAPYSYSIGPLVFSDVKQDGASVRLLGETGTGIAIEHRITVDPQTSWLEEAIKLTNTSSHALTLAFRCGFILPIRNDTPLRNYTFTAVPYRREPGGSRTQYSDYKLDQILYERCRSHLREKPEIRNDVARFAMPRVFTEDYVSEGWAATDGKNGFLITKYNQMAREFSILDRVPLPDDSIGLRWGGAGSFDDAEGSLHLAPGATHDFGVTRLTPFQGDFVRGYYVFRAEMESRNHRIPDVYDPPSHWNELYDNKLWWSGDHVNADNRKKFYRLADLKQAAACAQEMGCEALYLDPGWDTPQSSKIWGEERLGKLADFMAMLKNDYGGLKLSLHAPLSSWTGPGADLIPGTAIVRANGEATPYACGACARYTEETVKRLKVLGDAGVSFLMFDGTVWMGECWARDHGHSHPSTATEHVEGLNRIANLTHKNNPGVLIEMHDQLFSGIWLRYVPTYYGQGAFAPGVKGWDELWAFELMWSPMDDLVGGHSIALYYYNLAYSIPAYIHIDLRKDNEQCLMLWWNISTCRHLGVGGTHPDPAIRNKQKETIATYRRLKPFFATGTFYGMDELVHVHVDREKTGAMINCFNLDNHPVNREIMFNPASYGLAGDKTYKLIGAATTRKNGLYIANVSIPAFGHTLIEVT